MESTARRALSELIDTLLTPEQQAAPEPAPAFVPTPALPVAPLAVQPAPDHPALPLPVQRPAEPAAPAAVPAAFTVLPGGAKSAILWRSR